MNFKTPLCSHIDRFMVIVSKVRDGNYIFIMEIVILLASYDRVIWILEISNYAAVVEWGSSI